MNNGPQIPFDNSSEGADSPWLALPLILVFLAFAAVLYLI